MGDQLVAVGLALAALALAATVGALVPDAIDRWRAAYARREPEDR